MIKYNTRTGLGSAMDEKARNKRDVFYKPYLTGMKCKTCRVDTVISFIQHPGYAGSGSIDPVYDCCCPEFERAIRARLTSAIR